MLVRNERLDRLVRDQMAVTGIVVNNTTLTNKALVACRAVDRIATIGTCCVANGTACVLDVARVILIYVPTSNGVIHHSVVSTS